MARRKRRQRFPPAPPPARKPVKVTTTTKHAPPAATHAMPPEVIGRHAVTTNQEPPAEWPEKPWPPVDLPELTGYTVADSLPPQEPQPLTTSMDIHNVQYNDYNVNPAGDQTGSADSSYA